MKQSYSISSFRIIDLVAMSKLSAIVFECCEYQNCVFCDTLLRHTTQLPKNLVPVHLKHACAQCSSECALARRY